MSNYQIRLEQLRRNIGNSQFYLLRRPTVEGIKDNPLKLETRCDKSSKEEDKDSIEEKEY